MKKVIADIEIGDLKISSAFEMVEAFNCHFANIGHDLARDIASAGTVPESYLISTNATGQSRLFLLSLGCLKK